MLAGIIGIQPTSEAPSGLLVLSVIVGLPLALWTYKCIMMYVFQRRIIYMGYAPMGARSEALHKDVRVPKGIVCHEIRIPSEKRVSLSGIIVHREDAHHPETVIVYFQGNAGNPLNRLPVFDSLLSAIPSATILAVAPRSYWTSTMRTPTQSGLTQDYTRVLTHAADCFPDSNLVVYGHSLGGAIAPCVLAQIPSAQLPRVRGLILENPFSSVPAMLCALYPQKWLPYHHMGPLVWDRWDALRAVEAPPEGSVLRSVLGKTAVFVSERDEVVPPQMGRDIFARCQGSMKGGFGVDLGRLVVVNGALHEDAWRKRQWALGMKAYIQAIERISRIGEGNSDSKK